MSVFLRIRSKGPFSEGSIAHAMIRVEHLTTACSRHVTGARSLEALAVLDELRRALRRAFEGEPPRPDDPRGDPGSDRESTGRTSPGPTSPAERPPKQKDERTRRYLAFVTGVLAREPSADIGALLDLAPAARARHRAALIASEVLGQRGERTAARRLLRTIDDPALEPAVALARARLDLDGGHPHRAAARLVALPGDLPFASRARLRRGSRGEVASLDIQCARLALLLHFRLAPAGAVPEIGPLHVRALLRDPHAQAALWQHPNAAAHLFSSTLPRLRGALFFEARSELVASFAVAEARARLARAGSLRGTRADLDAAEIPTAEQAFALGVFCDPPVWETVRRDPRFSDPLSVARSAFDEGVARSLRSLDDAELTFFGGPRARPPRQVTSAAPAEGPDRRRALLEASRASLARLIAGSHGSFSIPSRVRTLTALGGPRAAAALEQALSIAATARERSPLDGDLDSSGRLCLFRALTTLAPERALSMVLHRGEILGDTADLLAALHVLERARIVLRGATAGAEGLLLRLKGCLPASDHGRWLGGLLRAFVCELGTLPGQELFAMSGDLLAADPSTPPEGVIERLCARRDSLLALPPADLPGALDDDGITLLLALGPQRFGPHAPEWPLARWRTALRRLDREIGEVSTPVLDQLRPCLPGASKRIAAMLLGRAPVPSLAKPIALDPAGRHLLRYLDKRRDLIAFLRFADSVSCCFHSTSHMYSTGQRTDTQAMVLSLWKDPLSFCFQVQRAGAGGVEPIGFVHGSLGLRGREPAVLLNGLYLRRRTARLRFAVVSAIEREYCAPMGIRHVAIAARYGGRGLLPPEYMADWLPVTRLRALRGPDGLPETRIYDDLSCRVNMEVRLGSGIHWRTLDPGAATPAPS